MHESLSSSWTVDFDLHVGSMSEDYMSADAQCRAKGDAPFREVMRLHLILDGAAQLARKLGAGCGEPKHVFICEGV